MSTTNNMGRVMMIAGLLLTGETAVSLEQPEYTVLYEDGNIEYRQYEPYLVAQTIIEQADEYNDAGNEGFRRLFRYITGANQSRSEIAMTAPVQQARSEKIAMTAPVQQTQADENWRVTFMLPTQYTMDSAPVPTDPRVSVERVPGRLMAVLRYSGRWTDRNFQRRKLELKEALDAEGLEEIGAPESALYNPPYTPPFLRRNEVMVQVNGLPAEALTTSEERLANESSY